MTSLKRTAQGGFTLLEMLAAIALLSIGFAIFLNAMGDATRTLTQSNQTTHLALLARSIFDDQARGLLHTGHWEGKLDDTNWQLTSTLLPGQSAAQLYRLELSLEQGRRQERFITLRVQGKSAGAMR